jgi:WD40 repeat protein
VGAPITHRTAVNRVSFSPDGRKLFVAGGAIGGADGEARLWDVSTGKPLGPALEILGETHDAAFSPDGKTFATGAFKLILWDAATSRPVWTAGTQSVIRSLCFSPDGQLLVHLVEEGTARLFDARTGMPLGPTLRHRANLWQSSLSPDGRFVLTCGTDQTARLWDAATGLPLGPTWGDLSASAGGAFTADSRGVLLQGNGALLQWGIPEPLEGSPERIRLAVEAAVRSSLDAHGTTKLLIPLIEPDPKAKNKFRLGLDPYEPVRKRLEELGGPPGAFRR